MTSGKVGNNKHSHWGGNQYLYGDNYTQDNIARH